MKKADVIIPVYKPVEKLVSLLDMLQKQTVPIHRIILINTEESYFERWLEGRDFWNRYRNVSVEHIKKSEFDHGGTRNAGVLKSEAEIFIFMTDDAIPADRYLVENLLKPFAEEGVAMSYARQLPDTDCKTIEGYTRSFNYPEKSVIKSAEDLPEMGIKTFFASNVCAAYRRDVFLLLNGFVKQAIFNEDMIYARGLIDAGYRIAYAADARVIHSHNYSGIKQLKRNFDLGVSHADYPKVFGGLKTESEGIRLVKQTCGYLIHVRKPWLIIKLIWQSGCKYIGYFLGKNYKSLPRFLIKSCSMNRDFWK